MTVRIGVIGVGLAGSAHVRTINDSVVGGEITALADIDITRAEALAKGCPGPVTVFDDAEALIRSELVDAVVITSIAPTHAELVLACIAQGKPVFCEKPLAVTADDCERIVEAEIRSGRHLVQVGFMRRFDPAYRDLRAIIREDAIGEVVAIHAAHRNMRVPEHFTSEMHTTEALIHEIDVFRWLLDDEYAQVLVEGTPDASGRLIDPQFVRFRTEGGRHIDVEVFVNAEYGYDITCEVVGRNGTAALPGPSAPPLNAGGIEGVRHHADFRTRFAGAYRDELVEWVAGIVRGEVRGPDSWDGLVAAIVSDAAVSSLHSGVAQAIELPDKPNFY
ncbi:Gfo/Idh/MocA family protein [Gulosibacter sp. 10]|uniref:Gfo/Idh/MocA family protein n=1 Tax=Gulosibacter sp. 10 TaxID=1255570 RepID=UPI00097EC499|nr:Gfo/Idh/MocA family oxidoreductase [Gulosibacter sp. 10]SJM71788.1 Myo-inositol 2-dehydrogenase [Gulosibacter sp. 10]